ncbi:MAG: hypothetical protein K2Q20_00420 [Phycisphaerales bacterium]|nr:hypothetical protein [Phycisphaerales bacterium]
MTEETLCGLIHAFNARRLPEPHALRTLSPSVVLGYVWLESPTRREGTAKSDRLYFIVSERRCVGVVLDMGEENLHWYVLPEHRKKGHLALALEEYILPHLFGDGRESQSVTVNSEENAAYALKVGFGRIAENRHVRIATPDDANKYPLGKDALLTLEERDAIKARLRQAAALVMSVHEKLECSFDYDALNLEGLAKVIRESAHSLSDLLPHGDLTYPPPALGVGNS